MGGAFQFSKIEGSLDDFLEFRFMQNLLLCSHDQNPFSDISNRLMNAALNPALKEPVC